MARLSRDLQIGAHFSWAEIYQKLEGDERHESTFFSIFYGEINTIKTVTYLYVFLIVRWKKICPLISSRNKTGLLCRSPEVCSSCATSKRWTQFENFVNLCLTVCHLGIHAKTICCYCVLPVWTFHKDS